MHFKRFTAVFAVLLAVAVTVALTSCGGAKKELKLVSEALLSPYALEMDYKITEGEKALSGTATVSRDEEGFAFTLLSPEALSGLCVKYSAASVPDSVEITYEGITTDMPAEALSRLNIAAALFTDDFAMTVLRLPEESVKQEPSESETHRLEFNYNGTDVNYIYSPEDGALAGFSADRDGVKLSGAVTKLRQERPGE